MLEHAILCDRLPTNIVSAILHLDTSLLSTEKFKAIYENVSILIKIMSKVVVYAHKC
jgi:hypothetical protein